MMDPIEEISHAENVCCYDLTFYGIYETLILAGRIKANHYIWILKDPSGCTWETRLEEPEEAARKSIKGLL